MKKLQIGIVGFGDFTKVLIDMLSQYADIVVSSRSKSSGPAHGKAEFAPLSVVLGQPIVIPSIPSQFFEEFFTTNKALINPHAIVIDVCSVKQKPLEVLQRLLPETCQIIGTHPMFGPASIKKNGGVEGLPCVLCPTRIDQNLFNDVKEFLASQVKLNILERTPEEHDREMAYVQGLSHYIGRVMDIMKIPESELQTLAYEDLLDMKKIQGSDSWDLFKSIMEENPYAYEINQKFKNACASLDSKLNK